MLLNLFIACLAPAFFFGNVASDCILDEVVDTESNCRWAAQMLGKEYMKDSKGPHYDWPAGCYYRMMSDDVHFNTILDPFGTNNLQYSSKGVCVRSMYWLYNILCIIENSHNYFQISMYYSLNFKTWIQYGARPMPIALQKSHFAPAKKNCAGWKKVNT